VHLSDVHALLSRVVLDDQLFKEQEGALVVDALPDLNLGDPQMWSVGLLAVIALEVNNYELNHEALLEESSVENLLLHGQFDLQALRVGLGVKEPSVNQLHALKTFDMLQTDTQELGRLKLGMGPWRPKVAIALAAVVELELLWNALSHIDLGLEALDAGVRLVGHHHDTAHTAATESSEPWGLTSSEQRREMGPSRSCKSSPSTCWPARGASSSIVRPWHRPPPEGGKSPVQRARCLSPQPKRLQLMRPYREKSNI